MPPAAAELDEGTVYARGGGQLISVRSAFEAEKAGGLGSEADGRFTFTVPEQIQATGRVTCLEVSGTITVGSR